MTALADARRRFAYHAWANARLADAMADGSADALAPARRLLAHVAAADDGWLHRLQGTSTDGFDFWPALTAGAVGDRVRANAAAWDAHLATLAGDDALGAPVAYANSRGERFAQPAADVLEHVLLHGAYHRGQAAAALRAAGVAPPLTDFIHYARSVEPAGGR